MNELRANMDRVDADFSVTAFKAKIADAEQQKRPQVITNILRRFGSSETEISSRNHAPES